MSSTVDIIKETKSREVRYLMDKEISFDSLKGFIVEISESKRKLFIKALKMPINTQHKKIPIQVLLKHIRSALMKDNGKLMLLTAIKMIIQDIYVDIEDEELEYLLEHESEVIENQGRWHYYWALQLLPEQNERSEQRLRELESDDEDKSKTEIDVLPPKLVIANDSSTDNTSLLKKLTVLERRIESEQKQRNDRDTTIALLKKQLIETRSKLDDAAGEMNTLQQQLDEYAMRESQLLAKLDGEASNRVKYEQERQEKSELAHKHKLELDELKVGHERVVLQYKELKQALMNKREAVTDMYELGVLFVASLYKRLADISSGLSAQRSVSNSSKLRMDMRELLDTVELIETFLANKQEMLPVEELNDTVPIKRAEAISKSSVQVEKEPTVVHIDPKIASTPSLQRESHSSAQLRLTGYFQRRDHGGYITLDSGNQINIPEHMVTEYSLIHEAEVRCTMSKQNPQVIQHIEVLLQGDESQSPVRQYMGYMVLGDHFNWYCVDIQDASNKFPLHNKDVQMRQLNNGDACLFNVEDGKSIARLSRLYNDVSLTERKKITAKTNTTNTLRKEKVKPYLEGCTVVVVGGLHKWFESVVEETGATYIHETGDNPDRVTADLKRANVLFLLITATSHRATWACTEIAKQYNIPQFIIQGSKSNLRSLMWENREMIQSH